MAEQRLSLPGEVWKPIRGHEGVYEISNMGRVWSVERPKKRSGMFLRMWMTPKGYEKARLNAAPNRTCYVHSLVLEAFAGARPSGMEAAHLNGDPSDNRLDNLAWVTSTENKRHQRVHGTQPVGARHHASKLTDADVQAIRRLRGQGLLWKDIAEQFGVSKNTARNAGLGLTAFDPTGALSLSTRRWHKDCDKPQS